MSQQSISGFIKTYKLVFAWDPGKQFARLTMANGVQVLCFHLDTSIAYRAINTNKQVQIDGKFAVYNGKKRFIAESMTIGDNPRPLLPGQPKSNECPYLVTSYSDYEKHKDKFSTFEEYLKYCYIALKLNATTDGTITPCFILERTWNDTLIIPPYPKADPSAWNAFLQKHAPKAYPAAWDAVLQTHAAPQKEDSVPLNEPH